MASDPDESDKIREFETQASALDDLIAEAQRIRGQIDQRLRARGGQRDLYLGPERRKIPR